MSLWKFNDFETEVDFTDVDFLERIEEAQSHLAHDQERVPIEGKASDIAKAQIECYDRFIDRIFGDGTSQKIFKTRALSERVNAVVSLKVIEDRQAEEFNSTNSRYQVNKGNRAQRRAKQHQRKKYYN